MEPYAVKNNSVPVVKDKDYLFKQYLTLVEILGEEGKNSLSITVYLFSVFYLMITKYFPNIKTSSTQQDKEVCVSG